MVGADDFFSSRTSWKEELKRLRAIIRFTGLDENIKWKQPCYTYKGSNVIILSSFKDCCFVSFLKGVLLQDAAKVLVFPGENSQSAKMLKFTSIAEIDDQEELILAYIAETIENEKEGKKVIFKTTEDSAYPEELKEAFQEDSHFQIAFEALTKGRQRGYLLHFTGAKQSATRSSRISQLKDRILNGYGLRDCTCGKSKRMPSCDGSHKYL